MFLASTLGQLLASKKRCVLCVQQLHVFRCLSRQRQQTIWWFWYILMCQTDCFTRFFTRAISCHLEVHPFCRQQSESWHDTQNTHVTSLDSFVEPRGLLWLGRSQWWLPRVESERVSLHSAEPGGVQWGLAELFECQSTTKVCQAIWVWVNTYSHPFLVGWTSINPSYFEIHQGYLGFWPIPISHFGKPHWALSHGDSAFVLWAQFAEKSVRKPLTTRVQRNPNTSKNNQRFW